MPKNQKSLHRRALPTAHKILLNRRLNSLYDEINGSVLIVGAGKEPYKQILRFADYVISTDIDGLNDEVDDIADVQSLHYKDDSFDYVLAIEVFEHLERPQIASNEILRVLKPGGKAVITVPFMFRVHGDPFDYQRFTERGLTVLFERFCHVHIEAFGGRSHVVSDIITTSAKPLFFLRWINWFLCFSFLETSRSDCPSGYYVELSKRLGDVKTDWV